MNAQSLIDRATLRRAGALSVLAAFALLLAGLISPSAGAAACSNEAIREAQSSAALPGGTTYLPDCMALEMVSPPQKGGQPAKEPAVSADGNRVVFRSSAALDGSNGNLRLEGDPYVSSRDPGSGWVTAAISPPAEIIEGWESSAEANGFSPDFSRWFQLGATQPQTEVGIARAFAGGLGGLFFPISPLLVPMSGGEQQDVEESRFQGASADHSRLYFVPGPTVGKDPTTGYLPGDPEPKGIPVDHNTYVARLDSSGEPSLELLARDKDDKAWGGNCGTRLGGIALTGNASAQNGLRNQGAVSAAGTRVYFSTRPSQAPGEPCDVSANKMRILVRDETGAGPVIGPLFSSQCSRVSPPCSNIDGDDLYQGASLDQTKVYITTNRQLTNSDLDGSSSECKLNVAVVGCDLYLYEPGSGLLTQVSAGEDVPAKHEAGKEADVFNSIAAISTDGSHVYFAAQGVLTADQNPEGDEAEAGKPNLYLYERDEAHPAGNLVFVGTVDPADQSALWGGAGGTFRNGAYPVPATGKDAGDEVGGDGHVLFFNSKASLTANDADGGYADIFRYDAAADPPTLQCVSCAPGSPDVEPFQAVAPREIGTPGPDFAEAGRWAGEDGNTALFISDENLVASDENTARDTYMWRQGQLYRLPGTTDASGKLFDRPFLSHDGSEAAFVSFARLLPSDGDTAKDVYVVRAGGGFAEPEADEECVVDEIPPGKHCREELKPPPAAPKLGSEASGKGNPRQSKPRCPKGQRKARRKGGKVRCVKRHKHQAHRVRHANTNRRTVK